MLNDNFIVYNVSNTKMKMVKFIEDQLNKNELYDLIPTHGNILSVLYRNNGKLTMTEISNLIGRNKSTVTSLIETLLGLGYIEKEKCPQDKRVTYIVLTQKGKDTQSKFLTISKNIRDTAYTNFTEEEKQTFLVLLKKLNNNFNLK